MKRVIVIPARYGSTRLPGKPLREIAGKPLIQWVYERARESSLADEVMVATDDGRIHDACAAFGAQVVMTSPDCKSGTDRVYEAVKGRPADIVVNVQGDEPLIRGDMIDQLFSAIEQDSLDMATLCAYLSDRHEYTDPHTVKVVMDKKGFALYFSRAAIPFMQRTIAIPLYKHIGIYGYSRNYLEAFVGMPKGGLEEAESLEQLRAMEAGVRIRTILVDYEGFGVDTESDLERMHAILAAPT